MFSSYSAPDGDEFGDMSKGVMKTTYGFKDADYAFMEAETTWDINREIPYQRDNEETDYWLWAILEQEE